MLMRDAIPSRDEYAERFGLKLQGRGRNISGPCGIHGGSDSGSFHEDGRWYCFACGAKGGDMLDYHRQVHGLSLLEAARELGAWRDSDGAHAGAAGRCQLPAQPPKKAAQLEEEPRRVGLAPAAARILESCRAVHGTIGESYLRARHCALPPAGSHLGFHPDLLHPKTGYRGPALVALVTHAVTREPLTLHRTWIRENGKKADVEPPRMLLADHTKQEGVVRLWPDECVNYGLAVTEGIETALSLAHSYTPVWACIDAGNLGALPVLAGVETLLIGADNDAAGARHAEECAARWWAAGAGVLITQQAQNDLNDALAEADT